MRQNPAARRRIAPLLAIVLAASAAAPSSVTAQDTAAVRIARDRQELEKVRAETRKTQAETAKTVAETRQVEAETRKAEAETANLTNWWLRFIPVFTTLVAVLGAVAGVFKFINERKEARRAEVTESVKTLLPLLGGSDPNARITAATTLGVIATGHAGELPDLPRQVASALFAQMAQATISATEQSTFANVVSTLLADRTHLVATPPPGANLSGVSFDGLALKNVRFEKTQLSNASFEGTTLDGVTLEEVTATGTTFTGAVINSASFDRCELNDASFDRAGISRLAFRGCTLMNCAFTNLPGTPGLRFEDCPTLFGLTFEGTDVSNLAIGNAGDVAPNTIAQLKKAKGISRATLDQAMADRLK